IRGLTETRILSPLALTRSVWPARFYTTRRTRSLSIVGPSVTIGPRTSDPGDAFNQNRRADANDSSPHAGCAAKPRAGRMFHRSTERRRSWRLVLLLLTRPETR